MDIGKRKDDYVFYEGYEGEKEIIISLPDIAYHIWDGYFDDIFGNPQSTENGWIGFTRDYNEFINAFEEECIECAIEPEEYRWSIDSETGSRHIQSIGTAGTVGLE